MTRSVDVDTVRRWLADGGEIAFLDIREEGQHGSGHPLLAVNLPYSRLETEISRLVPRRSCRIVLLDDMDGVAAKASRRLARARLRQPRRSGWRRRSLVGCGHPLFPSTNVPSKGFAEIVEHEFLLLRSRPRNWTGCGARKQRLPCSTAGRSRNMRDFTFRARSAARAQSLCTASAISSTRPALWSSSPVPDAPAASSAPNR